MKCAGFELLQLSQQHHKLAIETMMQGPNKRIVLAILAAVAAFDYRSHAWVQHSPLSIASPTTGRRFASQSEGSAGRWVAESVLPRAPVPARRRPATNLHATGLKEDETPLSSLTLNGVHVAAWIALVAFAFVPFAPGAMGSDQDNAMLQAIIADPLNPAGVNAIFLVLFNLFGPMPVILASLLLPQQTPGAKIPAGPFLIASSAIGYFAMGPYLALRAPPQTVQANDWFTRNVAENKIVSWALVVLCGLIYAPLPAALMSTDSLADFIQFLASSRFATISTLDLTILYIVATKAIYDDYRLRAVPDDDDTTAAAATKVALATAVVPYLGAAVYCALRPTLEQVDE
jgi:hypothetical protein